MFIYCFDKNREYAGCIEIEQEGDIDTSANPNPAKATKIAPPEFKPKLHKCLFDLELKEWQLIAIPQPPPPEPLPDPPLIVSPRQIRQALTAVNLRSQVEAAVAAGDQNLKDWWEFATQFEENHPQVAAMCAALEIADEQRHQVFVLAGGL